MLLQVGGVAELPTLHQSASVRCWPLRSITAPLAARFHHPLHCLQKVTQYALYYMDAQRVGTLPADNEVPYRSNALVYEESIGPANGDISGGWLEGGALGNLKMTVPTAFSTSLLAWGLIAFPTVSSLDLLALCSRNPKLTVPPVFSIGLLAGGLIAGQQISFHHTLVMWQQRGFHLLDLVLQDGHVQGYAPAVLPLTAAVLAGHRQLE